MNKINMRTICLIILSIVAFVQVTYAQELRFNTDCSFKIVQFTDYMPVPQTAKQLIQTWKTVHV